MNGYDEAFVQPIPFIARQRCEAFFRPSSRGDETRDWQCDVSEGILFPYDKEIVQWSSWPVTNALNWMWPLRTVLWARSMFGGNTYKDAGRPWWDFHQFPKDRARSPFLIAFAEIATHNHFVLDRGGKVFNRTAPVIKLPAGASEAEHLVLLGLLNSSVACFWMKQVSHQKQMMGGDGIRISEKSKVPYQFASTQLRELPLPSKWPHNKHHPRLLALATQADSLARKLTIPSVDNVIEQALDQNVSITEMWNETQVERRKARSKLVLIQEEIDFLCYLMFGLIDDISLIGKSLDWDVTIDAGDRPFCIVSQENVDGFDVPKDIPVGWPEEMRALWLRRIDAIKHNPQLKIIEDPHYKRRWIGRQGLFNHDARSDEFKSALRRWLLSHLESPCYWVRSDSQPPNLTTTSRLADIGRQHADFMQVAELYTGRGDFDVSALVADLVAGESVPFLPVLRYTEAGLRKREQWEAAWALQRREDAGEKVADIPVPPKYRSTDFLKTDYWRLRGGLDVPKERWVSYPGCERGADGSLVVSWAGWDALKQATALAAYYLDMKENEGWAPPRLHPLLAGLQELVPWLKQWHNDYDPEHALRMGDYFDAFVTDEARTLGLTLADLRAWRPPATAARRGRKAKA